MGVVRWLNLLILFLDSFNRCGVNLTRTYQLSISGPGVCFGTISVSVITPFPRATIVGAPEEDKFIEVASVFGALLERQLITGILIIENVRIFY